MLGKKLSWLKMAIRTMRPLDFVAIAISLAVVAGISTIAYGNAGIQVDMVRIQGQGQSWVFPLDAVNEVLVDGPLGSTSVVIGKDGVFVSAASCPDKLCMAMGTISNARSWIACMPNRIFIQISGENQKEIDALSY